MTQENHADALHNGRDQTVSNGPVFTFLSAVYCYSEYALAGSVKAVYDLLNSSDTAPAGNLHSSYTTIASFPGLMFGIINIVG